MSSPIRTWKFYDITEIKAHLIIVGQLSADCANCKAMGIDYLSVKACPACKAEFKYIATRQNDGRFPPSLIRRIIEKRQDLELIDYSDFKLASDRNKVQEFFKT